MSRAMKTNQARLRGYIYHALLFVFVPLLHLREPLKRSQWFPSSITLDLHEQLLYEGATSHWSLAVM